MIAEEAKKAPSLRFRGFTDDWEQRTLSTLMDFSNGINAPKENYGKGRKMISVMDILSKEPILYDNIRNSVEVDSKTENNNKVEYGDIVFVRSSEVRNEVGWAKAYLENEFALYSGFTIRGKKIFDFDAFFVELSINGKNREQIESKAGGSTRFNVSQSILKSVTIFEPSLAEQNQIGSFFKQIDDTIALHQRKLNLLKQLKQTYLQVVFPQGEEKNPSFRFAGFSEPWEQRKLGGLSEIVRGASPRPIQDPKWFDSNSNVGWLRISDVTEQNGRITYLEQKISMAGQEKTRVLFEPHLLMSIAATVGKPVINYINTGVHDGFLIFLNPTFDLEYMFQWLEMFRPKWQQYGQPGSQVNLNSELVKNQEIMIPLIEEQVKIGIFLKQLDDTIALHQSNLQKFAELKKVLLAKMFV